MTRFVNPLIAQGEDTDLEAGSDNSTKQNIAATASLMTHSYQEKAGATLSRDDLRQAFDRLTRGSSEAVERTAFMRAGSLLGISVTSKELEARFAALDTDGVGAISFDQFCEALAALPSIGTQGVSTGQPRLQRMLAHARFNAKQKKVTKKGKIPSRLVKPESLLQ